VYQSKALAHREIPPAPANQPLTTNQIGEFSTYLGVNPLPAVCISAIEQLAVTHRRAVALSLQGHTKNSVSRHLRRAIAATNPKRLDAALATLADPTSGVDAETFSRVTGIDNVTDPDSASALNDFTRTPPHRLEAKLASVMTNRSLSPLQRVEYLEARLREVEALPRTDGGHACRIVLVAYALATIWCNYAHDPTDRTRQWKFTMLLLEVCGEGSEGIRRNPNRLKRDLGRMFALTAQKRDRPVEEVVRELDDEARKTLPPQIWKR
jgi:hypothetical protein